MPREIVRFSPNVVVECALKYAGGKPVEGQFGPQVMYTLADERVMYLDPGPAKMVETLGPKPGEPFMIVKKSTGRREERPTWDVYLRVERASSPLEARLQESIVQAEGRKAAASAQQAMPAPPARGTGTYGPAPVRQMPAAQPHMQRQYVDAFALFLVDAGRATRAAEIALGGEGGSVRFDSRDVAAIATSMFIAADKAGFLQWNGGGE